MPSRRSLIVAAMVCVPLAAVVLAVALLIGVDGLMGRWGAIGAEGMSRAPERPPSLADEPPPSPVNSTSPTDQEIPADLVWRGDARIDGRMVDPDTGEPAPGVKVELLLARALRGEGRQRHDPTLLTTVTDAHGRFTFRGVARRTFRVRVTAPGRRARVYGVRTSRPSDEGSAPQVFDLGPDVGVKFVVVGTEHEPIVGATLIEESLRHEIVGTQSTDAQGRMRWSPREEVRVWFRAPGYADQLVTDWSPGRERRVVLAAGHPVSGRVSTKDGSPVAGVSVEVSNHLTAGRSASVTDARGQFVFTGLPEIARLRLTVRAEGYLTAAVEASTGRDDVEIVLRSLLEPGAVSGVVLRSDGVPAAGILVNLRARTDRSGRFVLDRLPPGDQWVSAQYGEITGAPEGSPTFFRERGAVRVHVKPGETLSETVLQLEPVPISFLPVLIVDERGRPMGGVVISTREAAEAARTDSEGRALLHFGLPPGTAVPFDVGAVGVREFDGWTRALIEGDPLRIEVPRAELRTLKLEGVAKGASVRVRIAGRDDGFPVDALELSPGVYALSAPPGEPLIAHIYHGERLSVRLLDAMEGAPREETIDLARGATLRVTVKDRDGAAVPRGIPFVALAHPDSCRRGMIAQLQYVGLGVYEVADLPTGRVELMVYDGRSLAHVEEIDLPAEGRRNVTVTLRPPLTVRGEVRDGSSAALGGARIEFLLSGGIPETRGMGALATSGTDGSWTARVPDVANARLAITREGRASVLLPVATSLSASAARVALPEEGIVRVLPGDRGAYLVHARLPSTDFRWVPDTESAYTVEVGLEMRVRRLPIGDVLLVFRRDSGERIERTVRVVPGQTTDLVLSDPK